MSQENSSPDKVPEEIIRRYEEMKEENKILYLDADQYASLIEHYINEDRIADADEAAKAGLKIHPDHAELIVMQADLYIENNQLKEARKIIDKVLLNENFGEDLFNILLIHTELLFLEGKTEEAELSLNSIESENIHEASYLDLAYLTYGMGLTEKSVYWLKKALRKDPDNEEMLSMICDCYQELEQHENTIEYLNKLLDKHPYSSPYWIKLAKTYFNLNQFDKSVEASEFAIVSDDKAGEAYAIKGHSFYQLDNYEVCIEAFQKAWELKALETEHATMFIGLCYLSMEDWEEAYTYLNIAIDNSNENAQVFPDLLLNAAFCLNKAGKPKEAHHYCELAQKHFPNHLNAHLYNGKYYMEEGDRDRALENWDRAVKISPTVETWSQIGLICMENGEVLLAQNAFRRVEEIKPGSDGLSESLSYLMENFDNKKYLSTNKNSIESLLSDISIRFEERGYTADFKSETNDKEENKKNKNKDYN